MASDPAQFLMRCAGRFIPDAPPGDHADADQSQHGGMYGARANPFAQQDGGEIKCNDRRDK